LTPRRETPARKGADREVTVRVPEHGCASFRYAGRGHVEPSAIGVWIAPPSEPGALRGVYVLLDEGFRYLSGVAATEVPAQA